jgi:hypothetical protein
MANKWIEFVKAHAAKNNISYTCAMCDIKTKGLYKPTTKPKKEEPQQQPKTTTIKIKKQKPKKEEEYEEEEEEEKEENPDIVSYELQQLLFLKGTEKIKTP